MTQEALFGELRSILQQPASVETWDALCGHLDLWDHDALEQIALPYTLDIINRWPRELERRAPYHWIERLVEGEEVALMAAANVVELGGRASSPEARAAVEAPTLLRISGKQPPDERHIAAALAAAPHAANLTQLDLSMRLIGAAGAAALAAAPHLSSLRTLSLRGCLIGDAGVAALAASPHLARLEHLDLSRNALSDAAAEALIASPHLTRLTDLDLGDNKLSDAGSLALAASPHLSAAIINRWRKP